MSVLALLSRNTEIPEDESLTPDQKKECPNVGPALAGVIYAGTVL